MSLSLQSLRLEILLPYPKFFITIAVVLIVVAWTSFEKRGRRLAGRAPMVSYRVPWVGSGLEIGRDPDAFFDRARWVIEYGPTPGYVADLLSGGGTVTCLQ